MKLAELIALRDDALGVIIEIYRMPCSDRLGNADRQFALQRAIAMFNAATEFMRPFELTPEDSQQMLLAINEHRRLKLVEECAYAVVKAWASKPMDTCPASEHMTQALLNLSNRFPGKGGVK